MRIMHFYFLFGLHLLLTPRASAQANSDTSQLIGTWKGMSLCQVKNSPCNDEIAVYHVNKSKTPHVYKLTMNKMVNGAEEVMGDMDFVYDKTGQTLTCIRNDRFKSVWKLEVKGKSMTGSLTINGKTLYRVINLKKE